ncbi:glycosyltransferase family 2 protein [Tuwongella immobilis]|uniref:Glycosyltransferase 2-like domain-containing protein n=1 Tax=Tuwongella immobilis TaxID=692036 RepID=A0A6C2YX81_9BACT|nr:glycosyltransferase family 2 protein [Tuwongella immobilis]VIP05733.1 Marine sediment metagenome DNA, contig: S01H1_L00235 OS=marine sediment metagenome GN=S01H1_03843 PE=4 SV=1: Glyco_tranf_2_3 [Tuwongella immobilis]VTS08822.1 Marine sediment metagenome DNA, contig: S01H1_L00235 OS=marine sediment metagenome GN=S01H1_03843 PE=4 SV=1: Glyco_tranf_2_3 [Tuwongella immobilis]
MALFISVVVPVRNEAKAIETTIRQLYAQDYPPSQFEVIVADGRSTDDTVAIVRRLQAEFPSLRLEDNPRQLASAARNVGIRASQGDVVIIIDGHCNIPDPNYLRHIEQAFVTSGAESLGRPQPLRVPNPTPFQLCLAIARESKLGHNPHSAIYDDQPQYVAPQNVAVAYRRNVFEKVGLFDESFDACEDVEFNTRVDQAGFRCYFEPKLRIDYHPRSTYRGLFVQMARYGTGRCRLARKHRGSLTLPALVPPLWLAFLIVGGPLSLIAPMFGWLFGGLVALYSAVILLESLRLSARHGWWTFPRIPLLLLTIHAGFGWGFLRECLPKFARTRRTLAPLPKSATNCASAAISS